jgi:dTDP-4-dehydrorhamnose 3,5-epimerase
MLQVTFKFSRKPELDEMRIQETELRGVFVIEPMRHSDNRGFFSETYSESALKAAGIQTTWVQDNHSFSVAKGVVRGLHFQTGAKAQTKLLRVTRGSILDVAVDIRVESPTFGRHVAIELSAENWKQLYIPEGFAHGFCTLTENCEVMYKVSNHYAPEAEGGLLWNDKEIGIEWPISPTEATLSDKDQKWPVLTELKQSLQLKN